MGLLGTPKLLPNIPVYLTRWGVGGDTEGSMNEAH